MPRLPQRVTVLVRMVGAAPIRTMMPSSLRSVNSQPSTLPSESSTTRPYRPPVTRQRPRVNSDRPATWIAAPKPALSSHPVMVSLARSATTTGASPAFRTRSRSSNRPELQDTVGYAPADASMVTVPGPCAATTLTPRSLTNRASW